MSYIYGLKVTRSFELYAKKHPVFAPRIKIFWL